MRVEVEHVREGRFEITARGQTIVVDRLPEHGGPGDGFRPTELLLGALGACMAGTLAGFAENEGIELKGLRVELDEEHASAPKRVGAIRIRMQVGADVDERRAATLRRVASRCTIHNTLADGPEILLDFTTEVPA